MLFINSLNVLTFKFAQGHVCDGRGTCDSKGRVFIDAMFFVLKVMCKKRSHSLKRWKGCQWYEYILNSAVQDLFFL